MQESKDALDFGLPEVFQDDFHEDTDLVALNRLYLSKAREMTRAGAMRKAAYLLGMPQEALELLSKMSLPGVSALAESGILLFGWRTSLTTLRDFKSLEGLEPRGCEPLLQLIASHGKDGQIQGGSHGRILS